MGRLSASRSFGYAQDFGRRLPLLACGDSLTRPKRLKLAKLKGGDFQ
jgi:hypothetical protein